MKTPKHPKRDLFFFWVALIIACCAAGVFAFCGNARAS